MFFYLKPPVLHELSEFKLRHRHEIGAHTYTTNSWGSTAQQGVFDGIGCHSMSANIVGSLQHGELFVSGNSTSCSVTRTSSSPCEIQPFVSENCLEFRMLDMPANELHVG